MTDKRNPGLFEGHWWTRAVEAEQAALELKKPTKASIERFHDGMTGMDDSLTWYEAMIFYASHAMKRTLT